MWAASRVTGSERMLVGDVLSTGTELIRYTQVGFEPGSTAPIPAAGQEAAAELRDAAIIALEDAIAFFDRIARNAALQRAVEASFALGDAAERLDEAVKANDPGALASALDAEAAATRRLAEAAADLAATEPLRDAIEQRSGEIGAVQEEVRRRMAAGKQDEAERLGARLADMMRDLSAAVQGELARRQQNAEDQQQQAQDLLAELESLENEQRALQKEIADLRTQVDAENADQVAKWWAELERRSAELGAHADAVADGLERADRPFFEQERGRAAADESVALSGAISARDVRGAREEADRVQSLWQTLSITATREARGGGPGPAEIGTGLRQARDISKLLDQLEGTSAMDPSMARLQEADARQKELAQRLGAASEQARKMAQQLPVNPRGLDEDLSEAGERMGQASEELGQGRAMQAEGEQSVAADRVGDARQKLEQAMQQAGEQAAHLQQEGGGQEQQEGEGQGRGSGDQLSPEMKVEIPGREEFRTPEEYRRALLQGMEGDVPEEYRALKKRYYEELVAQ
jgi:hypothetical protein